MGFFRALSLDLTSAEIWGEILVAFSPVADSPVLSSSENLIPLSFNCFQLILWEFWRTRLLVLGISLCYGIIHSTVFPFSICGGFLFVCFFPTVHSFLHLPYVHPFSYSANCLGLSLLFFLKSFPFLFLPAQLLPKNSVLTEVHVHLVITCTRSPCSLRTECSRCSKRGRGLFI